jgi:peptide/nickel transport system substrate-binding protein
MLKSLRRSAASLLPPLALALLLAACGGPDSAAGPAAASEPGQAAPHRGGTVVLASTADLGGLNELTSSESTVNLYVHRLLFHNLLDEQADFTSGPATFKPLLARSWEWSPDHKVLTLRLREGLVWSDGAPITAEDVRFSWQAQVHPDVAWGEAYFKQHIDDVEVVDPLTVRVRFDSVYATQLLDFNEGFILPKHAWGKLPFSQWRQNADFFRDNLVTSGPFVLEAWRTQQEIALRRNPRYFDPELPRLDRVVFRVIPMATNQVTQLLAGGVDVLPQVPSAEVERIRRSDRAHVEPYWGRRYVFVMWNVAVPLFADAEVRRALTLAIDRETIVETLWGERARLSKSPIVESVWAHDKSLKPWPFDPQQARQILAARGWRDSDGDGVLDKGGKRFAFDLLSNQGNSERQAAAEMIQAQLKNVGIVAQPRILEFNTLIDRLERHQFDASMMGWGIPTTLDLEYAFHTRSITEGSNYGGYSSPEVDRLIAEVRAQRELADAGPLLHRLQQAIHRDQPFTFLWESQDLMGVANHVQDVHPNALSPLWNLKEWWVEPPGS